MSGVSELVSKAKDLGATFRLDGDYAKVQAPEPLPSDLMAELREHLQEIIFLLNGKIYRRRFSEGTSKEKEAQQMESELQENGVTLIWADALGEAIAIYSTESDRDKVPAGFIAYSDAEIQILFADDAPPVSMRLIHQAKRSGGKVIRNEPDRSA